MSKNIDQIFIANPASSMVGTDLFYLGRSPYGITNDMAITWTNVLASITAGAAGGSNAQIQYNHSGALSGDTGFTTNGAGAAVITNSLSVASIGISGNTFTSSVGGDFQFGSSVALFPIDDGVLQLAEDNTDALLVIASFENGPGSSNFYLLNSRSAVVGGHTTLQNGDSLGGYSFLGDDGTSYLGAGDISVSVNGTVSTGIMPTKMIFSVNNSAGTPITPLTINTTGNITSPYNMVSNNFIPGYTTTATAASTTVLTSSNTELQYFTGSTTQTVTLPITSTLLLGHSYTIVNNSTGIVTVQSSGANTVTAMAANTQATFTCILTSGTTAASWYSDYAYSTPQLSWAANSNSSISAAVGNGYILTSGSATTVTLPTTFAVGSRISVAGQGAAWAVALGAATNIKAFGNTYTTSLASTNNTDTLELIATVANTTWSILSMITTGFTAS